MSEKRSKAYGKSFYYNFIAGAQKILEHQKELNKLNVFPVPDADTGSNLASTIRSIIENTVPHRSIKKSAEAIAYAALEGARGNSGVILAQYLYGFSVEASEEENRFDIKNLTRSLKNAVKYMYDAVANPVEGTMITVIKNWADYLYKEHEKTKSITHLLIKSYDIAQESLKKTTNQIAILKKANVVDAGGKGIVLFLEGMIDFIKNKNFKKIIKAKQETIEIEGIEENISLEDVKYRFCTEALLRDVRPDKAILNDILGNYGDSIVIAGSKDNLRIHIHTDRPAELFYSLRNSGTIVYQKADDMKKQYETAYKRKFKIALVTDSSCDLPLELIDSYQIQMVPLNIFFGENHYLDKLTIVPEHFYRMLDESTYFPTTSQVNYKTFQNLYSQLSSHYDSIISVHLSKEFSGTFSNSLHAAEQIEKETGKKIKVVNSRQASGSLGLIVLRIARSIEAGMTMDEINDQIGSWIANTRIFIAVKTMDYFIKGGRVSPVKGFIAKILNLKPIVSVNGEGKAFVFDKAFSQKGILKNILLHIKNFTMNRNVWEFCILHAGNAQKAAEYCVKIEAIIGKKAAYIMNISPVIGLNSGIGAVAVALMTE